jgi:uncharacterized protein with ACT and thioredoxin-like domain
MNITNARYSINQDGNVSIIYCNIDGVHHAIPLAVGNRHYDEIMRQVDEGSLTIEEAD